MSDLAYVTATLNCVLNLASRLIFLSVCLYCFYRQGSEGAKLRWADAAGQLETDINNVILF